jgi:hypothetical protein
MRVKIQASNLPAICGSTLFMDKRARRDGTPVFVAPFITNRHPIANGGTDPTYDAILAMGEHSKGVLIDPDVVEPDSRCKYVAKKLLWNRPIWSANDTSFNGVGTDNDGADTPVKGTSDAGKYIVPASLCHFSALTGACADDVHANADGSPVVGLMMPATLQLLQHPTPSSITIGLSGESGNWREPGSDQYEENDITIGLGAVAKDSLLSWDEPEGKVTMHDHVSPWNDSGGGRCISYVYLNQWEVGKGMRRKKKNRGVDVSISRGNWSDLDRDAVDWLNKVYDGKRGTYAAMMGLAFNPGVHSDVDEAKARSIIRYTTYNYTSCVYAKRLFGIFMLSNRADMYQGLLTNEYGYDLTDLVFRESSDSLEAEAFKVMLNRHWDSEGGMGSIGNPTTALTHVAHPFTQVDEKWTEWTLSASNASVAYFTHWLAMDHVPHATPDYSADDNDIVSVLTSDEKTEVASLYGKDRESTWAADTKLQLTTHSTQGPSQNFMTLDLIPLPMKSSISKQIVNETGVSVSTSVTDGDIIAVYGPGSRLLLGVGQGYRTNPIHAFFEDGIDRDTKWWAHRLSGKLMWWWCGVENGQNA